MARALPFLTQDGGLSTGAPRDVKSAGKRGHCGARLVFRMVAHKVFPATRESYCARKNCTVLFLPTCRALPDSRSSSPRNLNFRLNTPPSEGWKDFNGRFDALLREDNIWACGAEAR